MFEKRSAVEGKEKSPSVTTAAIYERASCDAKGWNTKLLNLNIFLSTDKIPVSLGTASFILREPVFERVKTRSNNWPTAPGHPRWMPVAVTVATTRSLIQRAHLSQAKYVKIFIRLSSSG